MKHLIWCLLLATCLISCNAPSVATPTPTRILPTDTSTSASTSALPTVAPALTPSPVTQFDGQWQTQSSLLKARAAQAVVSTAAAIYALAGTGPGGSVLKVERFDGHAWTLETTLPGHGLNAPAAVVLDNRIYLIGGFNTTTNVPTSDVLTYDLATETWDTAPALPAPRGGHAAAVLDGKIHV